MIKAKIIRRVEIKIPKLEETVEVYRISYKVQGYPTRTIWIDKEKYSEDVLKKAILSDFNRVFEKEEKEIEVEE